MKVYVFSEENYSGCGRIGEFLKEIGVKHELRGNHEKDEMGKSYPTRIHMGKGSVALCYVCPCCSFRFQIEAADYTKGVVYFVCCNPKVKKVFPWVEVIESKEDLMKLLGLGE